jgi:hypothetical protein
MDRLSYIDAVGHESDDGLLTKALVSNMKTLIGKPVKTLEESECETLRLAFIYAESWFDSVADAYHNKCAEARCARSYYRKLHEYRVKRWGITKYEAMIKNAKTVYFFDLIKK